MAQAPRKIYTNKGCIKKKVVEDEQKVILHTKNGKVDWMEQGKRVYLPLGDKFITNNGINFDKGFIGMDPEEAKKALVKFSHYKPENIIIEDAERLENAFKYHTTLAGGMSDQPETCANAKENEEETSLLESIIKKAVKKKLAESAGRDKEWEIWTLYRRYEDEVNNKWEKELVTFDSKEEAEKYAMGSRYAGYHTQIVHRGDKPKKLGDL